MTQVTGWVFHDGLGSENELFPLSKISGSHATNEDGGSRALKLHQGTELAVHKQVGLNENTQAKAFFFVSALDKTSKLLTPPSLGDKDIRCAGASPFTLAEYLSPVCPNATLSKGFVSAAKSLAQCCEDDHFREALQQRPQTQSVANLSLNRPSISSHFKQTKVGHDKVETKLAGPDQDKKPMSSKNTSSKNSLTESPSLMKSGNSSNQIDLSFPSFGVASQSSSCISIFKHKELFKLTDGRKNMLAHGSSKRADHLKSISSQQQQRRLRPNEKRALEDEFAKSHDWSAQLINELAKRLGFKRTKIYKWNYERRKKYFERLNCLASHELSLERR